MIIIIAASTEFMGWANNQSNNLRFEQAIETKNDT